MTDPVPGMYLYREDKADGTLTSDVLHWTPGGGWQKVATVKGPTVQPPAGPPAMTMSPDRQHIAWLDNGTLKVSRIDGSQVKTLATDVAPGMCPKPAWAGDSAHLLYFANPINHPVLRAVNLDGTGRKSLGTADVQGCQFGSADGRTAYAVMHTSTKQLMVFDGGATAHALTAAWPSGRAPFQVVAGSVGSTRLLVSTVSASDACGCSPPQQYALVDTATGQVTSLDNANDKAGSSPISGMFTADGRVVLIADRNKGDGTVVDPFLTVFSSDGAILGSAPLPDMEYGFLAGFDN